MAGLGDVAASLGLPVFPCSKDKRPVVQTGFKAASRDAAAIRAAFDLPGADMIGVPTGTASGLVIIDVDIKNGQHGDAWLDENKDALPSTRTHKTRSGGLHLVFRAPEGVEIRNSAGRVAPGVDVRGEGGYVIVPPSPGYQVADASEPADMPRWLVRACLKPEPEPAPAYRPPTNGHGDRYAEAALRGECDEVARSSEGTRNHRLNIAAVKLGGLVAAGLLSRGTVEAELTAAALAAGLDRREVAATIASGLGYGLTQPRSVPERTERTINGHRKLPEPAQAQEDGPPQPKAAPGGIRVLHLSEIESLPPPEWLVDGLIPEKALVFPYGPPKQGKTFIVLSMALHIAAGLPWAGRLVKRGGVVYIAGEGLGGMSVRIKAMRHAYGIRADVPFWVIPRAINFRLTHAADDLVTAIRATVGDFPIALVVVDTLARAMPGADENSSQDVGLVIAGCDQVKADLGCTVMPVHHTGKDISKGLRGTSAIHGALDAALRIEESGPGRVVVRNDDQKDAEEAPDMVFEMQKVEAPGTGRTSLVPVLCADQDQMAPERENVGGQAGIALRCLMDEMAKPGSGTLPPGEDIPPGTRGVRIDDWRRAVHAKMADLGTEAKKKAFSRSLRLLLERRLIGVSDPWVWC